MLTAYYVPDKISQYAASDLNSFRQPLRNFQPLRDIDLRILQ